jgi:hypothetical protein
MRRLACYSLDALTLFSLLLLVATVWLCARSYGRTERYTWWRESQAFIGGTVTRVVAERGRIAFVRNASVECGWFMPMMPGFTSSGQMPGSLAAFRARGLIDWPARCWYPPIGTVEPIDVRRFAGFERGEYEVVEPYNSYRLREEVWAAPLPALACAFAILPVVRWRRRLLPRHRYRTGVCSGCGYDLRATPDRCPECGRIPPKVKS